jgi:hypothetical protein
MNDPVTIRASTHHDRTAILRLAALDSWPAPTADSLLALAGTELRAALPLDGGAPLADPFHPHRRDRRPAPRPRRADDAAGTQAAQPRTQGAPTTSRLTPTKLTP